MAGWPDDVLILDTETTTDAEQQLNFGTWRHCTWESPTKLKLIQEGLFYADDLPERNPEGYTILRAYARKHGLVVMSRESFCWNVFYPLAYSAHALVVGFNLPFDLTRIAEWCGNARKPRFGYFSLVLLSARDKDTNERIEHRWKARLHLKINNSKFSFIEFGTPAELDRRDAERELIGQDVKRWAYRGRFLDLRTLVFALTSEGHSLKSACALYGVEHGKTDPSEHGVITDEYIDYNRRDVLATAELLEALRPEFDAHPIRLDPCKAFSPAAIAKAYLRAMGIKPPSQTFKDIPKETYGIAMNAYYGGRAEANIRLMPVPVIHTDFVSMYPTVNALMGLGRFMVAETVVQEDFTDGARALLEAATINKYFRPDAWRGITGFALAEPCEDILPVRAEYDPSQPGQANIGVNYFTSQLPVWYSLPDLITAKLLGKKTPRIIQAIRLIAHGQQSGLKPITLPSGNIIDPAEDDFFRVIIEQRKRIKRDKSSPGNAISAQALKILANAGSYGISAECNQDDLPKDEKAPVTVYGGFEPFNARVKNPETPGEFSFPPFAALITGAARLMLALLEAVVTEAGGTYAFCDTDSMAIVATESGGVLPGTAGPITPGLMALSCNTVQEIVNRFEALNPYAKDAVPGSILEVQDVSLDAEGKLVPIYVLVISSKRYTFFRLHAGDVVEIVKPSEHGLGHLLDPYKGEVAELDDAGATPRWIVEAWESIVRNALGFPVKPLAFAAMPAMTRVSASTPHVLKSLRGAAQGEMRPATFLLSVAVARFGHPVGVDPKKFHLVSPYTSDRKKYLDGPWINVHSGREHRVTTGSVDMDPECVHVKTFGDVIEEFAVHPEPKSAGRDRRPCRPDTKGLLYRRHVRAGRIDLTGKESNRLEDVRKGQVHDWDEIVAKFQDPAYDEWEKRIRPNLAAMTTSEIAADTGVGERAARNLKHGHSRPSTEVLSRLLLAMAKRC
ncbi:MAG: DNA polymerase [Gemmatimonadota bacterium]|nr:DNA polymerase [Gemmatimonadota bacterium]